jgi:hypothetical protein
MLGCSQVSIGSMNAPEASKGHISSTDKTILAGISCFYYPELFAGRIRAVSQVNVPRLHTFVSHKRHSSITVSELSEHLHIGLRQSKDTLDATTQKFTRSAILPLSWHYRSDWNFYRRHLNHDFAADLYLGRNKSAKGNVGAYVFTHKCGFAQAYPKLVRNWPRHCNNLQLTGVFLDVLL